MSTVVTVSLLVSAIIHLLPLVGVLGASRLKSLYGLDCSEPNLAILLRHRAVLFGLLGSFLAVAAFTPSLQVLAFVAAFVSVASFLVLARAVGGYNASIGRVVKADLVALVALVVGAGAFGLS